MFKRPLFVLVATTIISFLLSFFVSMTFVKPSSPYPLSLLSSYGKINGFGGAHPFSDEKIFYIKDINELTLNVGNTNISIINTDHENVRISLTGKYFNVKTPSQYMIVTQNAHHIMINTNEPFYNKDRVSYNFEGRMEVEIPKTIKKVNIISVAGKTIIKDSYISQLNIKAMEGDVHSINNHINKLYCHCHNGKLFYSGNLQNADINCPNGANLTLTNNFNLIEVESISQDLNIKIFNNKNFSAALKTITGNVLFNHKVIKPIDNYVLIEKGNSQSKLIANSFNGNINLDDKKNTQKKQEITNVNK